MLDAGESGFPGLIHVLGQVTPEAGSEMDITM